MIGALLRMVPGSVWIGLLIALAAAGGVYAIDHNGYRRGAAAVQVEWDADRVAMNAKVLEFNAAARKAEADSAAALAEIEANLKKVSEENASLKRRDRAAALDGSLKLRVNATCHSGGGAGETAAPAGVSDGPQTIELPSEVAANLYDLANDADAVADQLASCQLTVRGYLGAGG